MKILLATPLYPPDIAPPAPYIKELARKLSNNHEVVVLAYGRLPEKVPGVKIVTVDKRRPLFLRLIAYIFALLRAARSADLLYAENGPSVELPAALLTFILRTPLVLHIGDARAEARGGVIARLARSRAKTVVTDIPNERPEILPFSPRPEAGLEAYESSWIKHLSLLENIFTHAK